ncbi:MotA/TolQ/ExbB proton channel family protein [Thorsellia anophelis]|uniref:MotA/TolQ/ExbB proton channel family protein n=1 Tax=Thorsellia anophelis DSM 18579 TaxID=1123402 RepID=A0A1I0D1Z1_9GAMM|nr:MotA/TolQ/ExbB proton channel family protein [Thorsellia anophelis]SET25943.1 MotA/TolQ/ExbB proton channel family protein [Thorsellia anophelis DSM 18579]
MFNTFYNLVLDGGINQQFFVVMLIIFFISLACLVFKKWMPFVDYTPSLLTSIGIFGTFLGIFFGLLDFNPATIDNSIETLLTGLKTAFVTSLIGLVLSMIFKTIHTIFESRHNASEEITVKEDITPAHIYQVLQNQFNTLDKIADNLIEKGDESSVGQLKLLREETKENQKQNELNLEAFQTKLWTKLDEFSDILSKSATETIIDALKSVIEDFNKNLTDQFGENFKELNDAVFKLVDWQNNNLHEMERLLALHKQNSESVEHISKSTNQISQSMSNAVNFSESLESVLTVNQHQINELSRHLKTFSDMRDKAIEAVPIIQSKIEQVTTELTDGASLINESMTNASTLMTESMTNATTMITESIGDASSKMSESSETISKQLTQAARATSHISGHFNETMKDLIDKFDETFSSVSHEFEISHNKMSEVLSTNTDMILNQIGEHTKLNVDKTTEALNVQFVTFEKVMQSLLNQLETTHQAILKDFGMSQDSISESVKEHTQNVLAAIESQVSSSVAKSIETMNNQANSFDKATLDVVNQFEQAVKAITQEVQTAQIDMSKHLISHSQTVLGGIEQHVKESVEHSNNAINSQLKSIDEGLEQSLNKALEDLGSALATIAGHLMASYKSNTGQ